MKIKVSDVFMGLNDKKFNSYDVNFATIYIKFEHILFITHHLIVMQPLMLRVSVPQE